MSSADETEHLARFRLLRPRKVDLGGGGLAVLAAQMAVGLHRKHAAVVVPQPRRHSRNIYGRLDADGGEEVPKIMVRHTRNFRSQTRRID